MVGKIYYLPPTKFYDNDIDITIDNNKVNLNEETWTIIHMFNNTTLTIKTEKYLIIESQINLSVPDEYLPNKTKCYSNKVTIDNFELSKYLANITTKYEKKVIKLEEQIKSLQLELEKTKKALSNIDNIMVDAKLISELNEKANYQLIILDSYYDKYSKLPNDLLIKDQLTYNYLIDNYPHSRIKFKNYNCEVFTTSEDDVYNIKLEGCSIKNFICINPVECGELDEINTDTSEDKIYSKKVTGLILFK